MFNFASLRKHTNSCLSSYLETFTFYFHKGNPGPKATQELVARRFNTPVGEITSNTKSTHKTPLL